MLTDKYTGSLCKEIEDIKMCNHTFVKFNDVSVCTKCGLTLADKKAVFDRKLPSFRFKNKKARKSK